MTELGFWQDYQSEIRRRSGLDERSAPSLFDHSLAFLANQGATSDFRHFTVGALLFVLAANLRQGATDPSVRREFLTVLFKHRDGLTAFMTNGSSAGNFDDQAVVTDPLGSSRSIDIRGTVIPGCLDVAPEAVSVASLIKTPWSPAKGTRCQ
jgi:hypothetical protein